MKRRWISTLTNIAYPLAGYMSGSWLVLAAMTLLGIGSAGFHWREHLKYSMTSQQWHDSGGWAWQKADEVGMYAAGWAIACTLMDATTATYILVAIAFAGMAYYHNLFDNYSVGLLVLFDVALASQAGWHAVIPLLLLGAAYAVRELGEERNLAPDLLHGMWHIMTAAAFLLLTWGQA